jgi:putative tryptophan/tyrosine transport system substrate-binding protein
MKRREFIAGLGAAAWPVVARAQQPAMPVIGFLHSASPGPYARLVAAFQQGLGETGYVEGRNVAIEYRWANDQYDRLPALAADLVRRQVTVIAANFTAALATRAATATIPIVFAGAADPVQAGLVASLARPGGNLTGATTLGSELEPKRLELLHELVPAGTTVAVLVNPTRPRVSEDILSRLQPAARSLGLQLHVQNVSSELDFDTAFATLRQLRIGGLVIEAAAFFTNRSEQLAALALRHAVPTVYQTREFAAAGGLMSYGGSFLDPYRLAGVYTGRILKGDKPADLPVQQSTKIELIINTKTAKALGLTVPQAILLRADEVIE